VVHGQYLSLYNIQDNKWIKHLKFQEGEILKLYKVNTTLDNFEEHSDIAIVLQNGSIYINME
jgi:hypothetical protein